MLHTWVKSGPAGLALSGVRPWWAGSLGRGRLPSCYVWMLTRKETFPLSPLKLWSSPVGRNDWLGPVSNPVAKTWDLADSKPNVSQFWILQMHWKIAHDLCLWRPEYLVLVHPMSPWEPHLIWGLCSQVHTWCQGWVILLARRVGLVCEAAMVKVFLANWFTQM